MAFLTQLTIPVSGMTAQRLRLDVIGQNVSNAETTRTEAGGPYRRQVTLFNEVTGFKNIDYRKRGKFGDILNMTLAERRELKNNGGVEVTAVLKLEDEDSPFTPVYDPSHPDANEDGYYFLPNVDVAEEELDAMAATQSYINNMSIYEAMVSMAQRTLSMGR